VDQAIAMLQRRERVMYRLQGAGGQVLDMGKYVVIWKQEAGQGKLHRDIWNSSRPAAGQ
jgi:hypothetical protein